MNQEEFIYMSNNTLEFRPMNPWIQLCFAVFASSFAAKPFAIDHIEQISKEVLSTLTPKEELLLVNKFGLNYQPEGSRLANVLCLTPEAQEEIMSKALRKLRHPSRWKCLRGYECFNSFNPSRYSVPQNTYLQRIEGIIKAELQGVLKNNYQKNVYITKILDRNQVSLQYQESELWQNRLLEEMSLSIRSFNCLKRAGIDTLGELVSNIEETPDFLIRVRNLGRNCAEEVEKAIQNYMPPNTSKDEFSTVEVLRGGQKAVYKFLTDDVEKIADAIYKSELLRNSPETTVLSSGKFSPGLTDILLMLGYFYLSDVFEDSEQLCERLRAAGFAAFFKEISAFACLGEYLALNGPSAAWDVLIFSPKIAAFARDHECKTIAEFKSALQENGLTAELSFINEVFGAAEDDKMAE